MLILALNRCQTIIGIDGCDSYAMIFVSWREQNVGRFERELELRVLAAPDRDSNIELEFCLRASFICA